MGDNLRKCMKCQDPLPERMFAFTDVQTSEGVKRRFDGFCRDCRSENIAEHRRDAAPASRPTGHREREARNIRSRAATTANRQLRFAHPQQYEKFVDEAKRLYPMPEGAPVGERQSVGALRARRVSMWMRAEFTQEYKDLFERAKIGEQQP